jgi:hypothetical protein
MHVYLDLDSIRWAFLGSSPRNHLTSRKQMVQICERGCRSGRTRWGSGGSAVGDSVRSLVLPHLGSLVLRASGLNNGVRSRCHHSRSDQGRHHASRRISSRWNDPPATHLRCGHRIAGRLVALLLAYRTQSVGKAYNALSKVEWWARMTTGWVFILMGVYFAIVYIFELPSLA